MPFEKCYLTYLTLTEKPVTGQASMYVAVGGSIGSFCLIVVIVVIAVLLRKRYAKTIVKILNVFKLHTGQPRIKLIIDF